MSDLLLAVMCVSQILFALVLMAVVIRDAQRVGMAWLSVLFFLLLLSSLIRRLDDISGLFGFDLINPLASLMLSWLILFILAWGKWQVHRRAVILHELEERYQRRIAQLEALREQDESRVGYSWILISSSPPLDRPYARAAK